MSTNRGVVQVGHRGERRLTEEEVMRLVEQEVIDEMTRIVDEQIRLFRYADRRIGEHIKQRLREVSDER